MSPVAKQPKTLLEVCTARAAVARGGDPSNMLDALRAVPKGIRVCERVILYAIATAYGSERPVATGREYAHYWNLGERQAARERATIHELFPGDELEAVVSELAVFIKERGIKRKNLSEAQAAPVGVSLGVPASSLPA